MSTFIPLNCASLYGHEALSIYLMEHGAFVKYEVTQRWLNNSLIQIKKFKMRTSFK